MIANVKNVRTLNSSLVLEKSSWQHKIKILLCKSKLTLMTLSKQLLVLPQKCLVCKRVIKITFATFLKIGFTTKLY